MNKGGRQELFTIRVVAEMLEVHQQTLRLYEREGLITPDRTPGNTRMYSRQDIERLKTILNLTRELGVNLAGVQVILNLIGRIEEQQGAYGRNEGVHPPGDVDHPEGQIRAGRTRRNLNLHGP